MDSDNKGINNFDVLKQMSVNNMEIFLLPNGTNRSEVSIKGENAFITYGAPKELGLRFLKGERFVGGVLLANEKQFNEVKAKLEDTSGYRYIALIRPNKGNDWYILENIDDDGKTIDKNFFFIKHDSAVNYVKDIIDFDVEANGRAVEGSNFIVIPVPFTPNTVETA